jgi:hypothetical protein
MKLEDMPTPETDAFYAGEYSSDIPPEIFEVSVGKEKRFAESLEKRLAIAVAALESVAVDSQERFIRGVAKEALAQIEEGK